MSRYCLYTSPVYTGRECLRRTYNAVKFSVSTLRESTGLVDQLTSIGSQAHLVTNASALHAGQSAI